MASMASAHNMDEPHPDLEVDQKNIVANCPFCPDILDDDLVDWDAASYHLFHEPCLRCSEKEKAYPHICQSCQHFRLWHLMLCVEATDPNLLEHDWSSQSRSFATADPACPCCAALENLVCVNYPLGSDLDDLFDSAVVHFQREKNCLFFFSSSGERGWGPSVWASAWSVVLL